MSAAKPGQWRATKDMAFSRLWLPRFVRRAHFLHRSRWMRRASSSSKAVPVFRAARIWSSQNSIAPVLLSSNRWALHHCAKLCAIVSRSKRSECSSTGSGANVTQISLASQGKTACRMEGSPAMWPVGHFWSADWKDVNCKACLTSHNQAKPKNENSNLQPIHSRRPLLTSTQNKKAKHDNSNRNKKIH